MPRQRFRCPVCHVIYPSADYVCRGGWPHYDPAKAPEDRFDPPHEPTRVVGTDLDPVRLST